MNKRRRRLVLLTLMFAVASLLPGATACAAKKIEVTLWHHWVGGERIGWVQQMLDNFNKQYPWIEAKQISQGTGGAESKLTSFIISGSAPELVQVSSGYAMPFMTQGGFVPLNDLAAKDKLNLRIFNSVDLVGFQYNNETYALPVTSGVAWTNLMMYNKTMMAEVGLNPENPPNTWDQWLQAARRMTKVAGDGALLRAGSTIPTLHTVTMWNGTQPWSDDWKKAQLANPRSEETAAFLTRLSKDVYGSYSAYAPWEKNHKFTSSDIGLWFQNNSAFGFLKDVDFEWGAKLAPVNSAHSGTKPVGIASGTWGYAIPATISDEKREAAWLLLKWLTTQQESAGWFTRIQGRPSAVTAFNRHPDYLKQNPSWNVVIEAVEHDIAPPPVNLFNKLAPISDRILSEIVHMQQGLLEMEQTLQGMLDDYWAAIKK